MIYAYSRESSTKMNLLDVLFPKRCIQCGRLGSYICPTCIALCSFIDTSVCAGCQRPSIDGKTHPACRTQYSIDGIYSSVAYKGIVKKLVYTFKYPPYLSSLNDCITELFYEGLIQNEYVYTLLAVPTVFVPIPIHANRLRSRGYNQAEFLANGLAKRMGIPVYDMLVRTKDTKTQVGLHKNERKENISRAFVLQEKYFQIARQCPQVFLIDDVATSGATLSESAGVLKRSGVASVWGITFAHGE